LGPPGHCPSQKWRGRGEKRKKTHSQKLAAWKKLRSSGSKDAGKPVSWVARLGKKASHYVRARKGVEKIPIVKKGPQRKKR